MSACTPTKLFYAADPMCSWCWGFSRALEVVEGSLREGVELHLLLCGLAPDSLEPMDAETRAYVQKAWQHVEARSGAHFEHSFWQTCTPSRSTWPACRMVLAAEEEQPGLGRAMFSAIQHAYYLEARDPSQLETLAEIWGSMGLPLEGFAARIAARALRARLAEHLALRDALGITGFPSVVLERDGEREVLTRGYVTPASFRALAHERGLLREGS